MRRVWQLPLHSHLAAPAGTPLPCSTAARDPPALCSRPPSELAPSGRAAAACCAPSLIRPASRRPRSAPPARADAPCCCAQERRCLRMLLADERLGGAMASQASLGWSSDVQQASYERAECGRYSIYSTIHDILYILYSSSPRCVLSVLICLLISYYITYM